MAWVATVVAVVGVVAGAVATQQQMAAAEKAQEAQLAAQRQAELNAKKQQAEALQHQQFVDQQAKAIKPADYIPGGVAVGSGEARGGGTFT